MLLECSSITEREKPLRPDSKWLLCHQRIIKGNNRQGASAGAAKEEGQ